MPTSSTSNRNYSREWGLEIIDIFHAKYMEGSRYIREIYDISDAKLLSWICSPEREQQERWENYKKACKHVSHTYGAVEAYFRGSLGQIRLYYLRVINEMSLKKWEKSIDNGHQLSLF